MQKSLPQAHQYAIEEVERAINYFEKVVSIVDNSSSLSEISNSLGRICARHLSINWGIEVIPEFRQYKKMPTELSGSEIQSQILNPLEHILSVYRDIKSGLSKGDFNYECEYRDQLWYEGCRKDVSGWTGLLFGHSITDIHICVDEIDPTDIKELASLIVHEASHKFGQTTDEGVISNAHVYDDLDAIPAYQDWGWVKAIDDAGFFPEDAGAEQCREPQTSNWPSDDAGLFRGDQAPSSWQFEPEVICRSDDPRGSGKLTTGGEQTPTPSGIDAEAGYFTPDTGFEQTPAPSGFGQDTGYFTSETGGEQTPAPSGFGQDTEYFTPDTGFEQTPAPSGFDQDTGYFTPETGGEQTPAPSEFGQDTGYFTPDTGFEQTPAPSGFGQDTGYFTPETGGEQTPAPSGFSDDMGYFTPDTGFEQSIQPPAWSGQDVGDFTPDTGFEQSFQPPVWSGQDVGDFTPETGFEQSIPPPDWST
jgi:hypothetical protein